MKVLTDTLCKEHYDLYTEIHGSIAVSQIRVAQKDFILLSSPPPPAPNNNLQGWYNYRRRKQKSDTF